VSRGILCQNIISSVTRDGKCHKGILMVMLNLYLKNLSVQALHVTNVNLVDANFGSLYSIYIFT
jgi:hypothetical protein